MSHKMSQTINDTFFQVPLVTKDTSEGPVEFPILYKDASCITAFFLTDLESAKRQLKDVPLEPGLVFGKKAIVGIQFYQYRDTTVGIYNEVGLAVPAIRAGEKPSKLSLLDFYLAPEKRKTGFYVVDLPVTTKAACAAGREMWGLPKFVTDIPFSLKGRELNTSVMDPQLDTGEVKEIFAFNGKMGLGIPSPAFSLKLYSYLGGDELATSVNVRYGCTLRSGGSMKLTVGHSFHPMAQRLRQLGLDGKSPLGIMSATRFQSRLNLGVVSSPG